MQKEYKGCLLIIVASLVGAAIIALGLNFDNPFVKNLGYVCSSGGIGFFAQKYLTTEKQRKKHSRREWVIALIIAIPLAALLAWLFEGRLW